MSRRRRGSGYPHVPGSVRGSSTSRRAGASMRRIAPVLAGWIELHLREHTQDGLLQTCEDVEFAAKRAGLPFRHQTISARIRTDLWLKNRPIFKVGTLKETDEAVRVWPHTSLEGLLRTEAGEVVYESRKTTSGREAWLYGWGLPPKGIAPMPLAMPLPKPPPLSTSEAVLMLARKR